MTLFPGPFFAGQRIKTKSWKVLRCQSIGLQRESERDEREKNIEGNLVGEKVPAYIRFPFPLAFLLPELKTAATD